MKMTIIGTVIYKNIMNLIKIETTLGGKNFILKFGFGLISYISEKEKMPFVDVLKTIEPNPVFSYKIIFHAVRYYEKCIDIESIWSDEKLWDLIDIESRNQEKIGKIMMSFANSFK